MLNWSIQEALLLTLLIFRTGALLMITPFFGSTAIPIRIRVLFAVLLAFCLMSVNPRTFVDNQVILSWDISDFLLNVLGEIAVGACMGIICLAFFSAIIYAGQVMDQSIGLSMADMVDPFSQQQGTVTGQFHYYLFMVIFLLLNGHLFFLEVFMEGVARVPLGFVSVNQGFIDVFVGVLTAAFEITVRFAAPVMFLCFLLNVALGFISKAVPSMNVFILGFPIKILMGLGLVMIGLGQIMVFVPSMSKDLINYEYKVLEALSNDG